MSYTKTLWIARHAEAEQSMFDDFNRDLTRKGNNEALEIAKILREKMPQPQLIISSPSRRTLNTAKIFAELLGYDEQTIRTEPDYYNASVRIWLNALKEVPEEITTLMIVGHNPHISYLLELLSNEEITSMSTASVACLLFEIPWQEMGDHKGKLEWLEVPAVEA